MQPQHVGGYRQHLYGLRGAFVVEDGGPLHGGDAEVRRPVVPVPQLPSALPEHGDEEVDLFLQGPLHPRPIGGGEQGDRLVGARRQDVVHGDEEPHLFRRGEIEGGVVAVAAAGGAAGPGRVVQPEHLAFGDREGEAFGLSSLVKDKKIVGLSIYNMLYFFLYPENKGTTT